jgi:hypothetical protein
MQRNPNPKSEDGPFGESLVHEDGVVMNRFGAPIKIDQRSN